MLAALAYGEECGARRSASSSPWPPTAGGAEEQRAVARREKQNHELIVARVRELGGEERIAQFRPFFDAFFARTDPVDWVEAQAFHYVGDALVSDFADLPSGGSTGSRPRWSAGRSATARGRRRSPWTS